MPDRLNVKVKQDVYIGLDRYFKKGQEVDVVEDQGDLGVIVDHPIKGTRNLQPYFRLFNHDLVKPKVA
jgi:hypothetical protein